MQIRTFASLFCGLLCGLAILAPLPSWAGAGPVDELKIGGLDAGVPLGVDHIENGFDINGEVLFNSPSFLSILLSPRPTIGFTANTNKGRTSYAYTGLTWTLDFLDNTFRPGDGFFTSLDLGGAIHDYSNNRAPGRAGLGTRLLFHEGLDLGYRFTPLLNVSLYVDHISNANLGPHNPGLTNAGLRFGFKF